MPVTGDRWLDKGGRVALVGPTGVGKTTTLAKLAVRWVLRHGPRDLALDLGRHASASARTTRFTALGQMLGVPVHTADSLADIADAARAARRSHRFVLIDTPGSSQRDAQLARAPRRARRCGLANSRPPWCSPRARRPARIEEIVARFAPAKPASCLLTKVDEAASLGGVLSVLTQREAARFPTSAKASACRKTCARRARSSWSRAPCSSRKTSGATADEDLLRRRFGEVAHALA